MTYSQKYCLVHFVSPVTVGYQFHMSEWPLHVTVADVFAINRSASAIDNKLRQLIGTMHPVTVEVAGDSVLGQTPVVLLKNTPAVLSLHENIANLIESNSGTFNNPERSHGGFIPHCTIQSNSRLSQGDIVTINSISLIDMYPDNDWQQRKVVTTFTLLPV